jgi:ATP-grasp ribosomal peptide maturase
MGQAVTLVLTHPFDPTADYVVGELNRRGAPVFRCNPGEFPQRLTITARLGPTHPAGVCWAGSLHLPERHVSLAELGCAYYRRPTGFDLPAGMSEQVRRWSANEARMGLGGLLATLPRWLNHPMHIARAEYKPVQLAHARACGLQVPATLITNDPAEAAAFLAVVGPAVYKPLTPTGITEQNTHRACFTTPVTAAEIDESIRLTAHLIQAQVDKAYEVRLNVADDTFLAARIDTASQAAAVDWRTDYDALTYTPLAGVPASVRRGVAALLARLRLRFGTFDFIVAPDDSWWFLEINPNGQWAWIEDATGLPITAAITDALLRENT